MDCFDETMMREAFKLAEIAAQKDEVPIGAVIVHKNKIIARAYNQVEMLKDPTAHAEMIAITQATNFLSCKWLSDCTMYVTIEPCCMCAGALVLSRIKRLCYGSKDSKTGACGSIVNITENSKLNHCVEVSGGILQEDCSLILSDFFRKKRKAHLQMTN